MVWSNVRCVDDARIVNGDAEELPPASCRGANAVGERARRDASSEKPYRARCDVNSAYAAATIFGDVNCAARIRDRHAIYYIEQRCAADTVCIARGGSTRAAAASKRGDDAGCDDDGADEVIIRDVHIAYAISSDVIRGSECSRAADAVEITYSSVSRKSRHDSRCDDDCANAAIRSVCDEEAARAINRNSVRLTKCRENAHAVGATGSASASAASYRCNAACCDSNDTNKFVAII